MRYDHAVTVPNGSSYQTYFCCLPLALSNIPGEIFENNLRDLYFSKAVFEGLIFGWAYIRRGLYTEGNLRLKMTQAYTGKETYVSKLIGLAHSWKEIYVSNFQKVFTETRLEDKDLTKTEPCKYFFYVERGNPSQELRVNHANSNIL